MPFEVKSQKSKVKKWSISLASVSFVHKRIRKGGLLAIKSAEKVQKYRGLYEDYRARLF